MIEKKTSPRVSTAPRHKPALEDMLDFITHTLPVEELSPLRRISHEVRQFLSATTTQDHESRVCDVYVSTESVISQCEVEDQRELRHCAVVAQRPKGQTDTLDIKCWFTDSGHAFISLVQFYDAKLGYSYSLTTDKTSTKYFTHASEQK